jgi:hypothetical protein
MITNTSKCRFKLLPVCAALLSISGYTFGYCSTDSEKKTDSSQSEEPVIQLNAHVGIGGSAVPIALLADTIQKDKTSNCFRLNWTFTIAGQGGQSTALYDRKKGTVKLYSTLEDIRGKSYKNFLYSGITDEVIVQLAEKYRRDDDIITDLSFIDQLPNGKDLGYTYISYEQKKVSRQEKPRK